METLAAISILGFTFGAMTAGVYFHAQVREIMAHHKAAVLCYKDGLNEMYRHAIFQLSEIRDSYDVIEAKEKCADAIVHLRRVKDKLDDA